MANSPEIRIATPYYKPGNNKTSRRPDYYLHETEQWLVFPHELDGLTMEEIAANKPELSGLLDRIAAGLLAEQSNMRHIPTKIEPGNQGFCADGFHPDAESCRS